MVELEDANVSAARFSGHWWVGVWANDRDSLSFHFPTVLCNAMLCVFATGIVLQRLRMLHCYLHACGP